MRKKKRKHSGSPTLSIFDEADRKISKSRGSSYLFYFTY